MVAFSRITFVLAVAGLSTAQSFSGPVPSGLPTDFPSHAFPSGAARPTGGFGGHHSHGEHSGFPHPTGGSHSRGPRPSDASVVGAQRAQQSGEAPFPSGGFSAFPSGAAKPSGHHGHHGHHGMGGEHSGSFSGPVPTGAPSAVSGLERRQKPSGTPPAFSGFPMPSGGFPSAPFPESGAPFPTGEFTGFPSGFPSGLPSGFPSGFPSGLPSGFPSGVAHPSGHHGHHGEGASGRPRPTGPPPSGMFSGPAPTGFVTSTIRGA